MTEEIIWKDPPRSRRGVWIERLTPLLEHPNRWAVVATVKSSATAHQLRKGMHQLPNGKWEFRHHATAEGNEIYARYLGPTEEGE